MAAVAAAQRHVRMFGKQSQRCHARRPGPLLALLVADLAAWHTTLHVRKLIASASQPLLDFFVSSSIAKPISITVSDTVRVSGLLQNPPHARS